MRGEAYRRDWNGTWAGIKLTNTRERERERAPYGERSDESDSGKGSFQETTVRCFPLDLFDRAAQRTRMPNK